jgi:hypothetical protein
VSTPPEDRDHWRALAAALLDDAALFPPGCAPMPQAVRAHRAARRSWHADLVGPFLCPTSRVAEMIGELGRGEDPLPVVLLADEGMLGVDKAHHLVMDDDRIEVVGLEVALPRDGDPQLFARHVLAALTYSVPAAIEVPVVPGWQGALDVLAEDGAERAKFRAGAPAEADVPSPALLAELIVAAVQRRLPFKLTAGLHHALRTADPVTGLTQHGFLNALAATALALNGADLPAVTAVLESTEAAHVIGQLRTCRPAEVRRWFTSFGTCSLGEPIQDLLDLGLLAQQP